MRRIGIINILPLFVALAVVAGCTEQKPAPEAQKQPQPAPQQTIEAGKKEPEPAPEPAPEEPAPEPAPEPAKPEPAPEPEAKIDAAVTPRATATGEEYKLPELEKVELPKFEYPEVPGKKLSIVFTGNVIGELEPCG